MTTIAWDGQMLAADRQCSLFRGSHLKIHRLKDGNLFGGSGDLRDSVAVREWLENGGDKPKVSDKFHAIFIRSDQLYVLEENLAPIKYERKCFAVGSGRDFAMAAMLLGKSAAEAVHVAHQLDVDTGPEVDELTAEKQQSSTQDKP